MSKQTKFNNLKKLFFKLYESTNEKNSIVNDKFINIDVDMKDYIDILSLEIENTEKQIKQLI